MLNLAAAFAEIAQSMSGIVGSPYVDGEIVSQIAPVMDAGGSIATPGGVDRAACRVQVDQASEYLRTQGGYTDKDWRFVILTVSVGLGSLTGVVTPLDSDTVVEIADGPNAGRWMVSSIQTDPAGIAYAGKGRRA